MAATSVLTFVVLCLGVLGLSAEKVRPCPDLDNACVGQYLASYSSCSVDYLPVDQSGLDPYSQDYFFYYAPYLNLTVDSYNITGEGLSQAYVKDFYYNSKSNKAALVLFLPYLGFNATSALRFLQTGEDETVDVTNNYLTSFNNITLTTVFEDYQNLELSKSFSFAHVPIPATYSAGQSVDNAPITDSRITALTDAVNANANVVSLEAFVYRTPFLVEMITNYKLCYYGL